MGDNRCQPWRGYPPMDLLMNMRSSGDADQAIELTESMYLGSGFLVVRTGLDGGMPSRSGVHFENISSVMRGPLTK